jgi:iron-sulfur cluster repair protein YtfE (RIC family)
VNTKSFVPQPDVTDAFEVFDIFHRDILTKLEELDKLVSDLDAGRHEGRAGIRELVMFFAGPAREHNYDEERHVFPTLLQHKDEEVRRAAETLLEDHAWLEIYWLDIEPQLTSLADGASTFNVCALRSDTRVFGTMMRDHIALEETLLYPQLRGRLRSHVVRSISREMAARRQANSTSNQSR